VSWPAANGIRCVKPSSAMLCPSWTCRAIASRRLRNCTASLDHGLRLLAHVLRQIIKRPDGLAGAARALPATECLVAGPRAGSGTLRAIGVGDARLDVLVEPRDLGGAAVEAGGESERRTVGERHGLVVGGDAVHNEDRQEHLFLPQRVTERRLGNRRTDEVAAPERAFLQLLTACNDTRAALAQARAVAGVVVVGRFGGYRS